MTIGSGVTSIGDEAFYGTAIYNNWKSSQDEVLYIGNYLIQAKSTLSGTYTIHTETKTIADRAFQYCTKLTSVAISESVTSIGSYAFIACDGLTSVTIGSGVTSIGKDAFYNCTGLTAVHITDIAAWCNIDFGDYEANPLYYAKHLYKDGQELSGALEIPNGVTKIPDYAFYYCEKITSVTIPESVTSIGYHAFRYCTGLTTVNWNATDCTTVGSSSNTIFNGCTQLTTVNIGENVKSIPANAFYNCNSLTAVHIKDLAAWCNIDFGNTSVNPLEYAKHLYMDGQKLSEALKGVLEIPNGVTKIPSYTFYGCEKITSVTIPDSVTSIGDRAFSGCKGLTSVTIPDSVTRIGESAFYNCNSLTAVHITDLAAWCNIDFDSYYANPLYHAHHLYKDGTEIQALEIPQGVTEIKAYAFYGCKGLTSVTIPESVTSIGDNAFSWCTNLTSVTISDSVTSIGSYTFYNCSSLTSVVFQNPSGWQVSPNSDMSSAESISVEDATLAAQYLSSTYYNYYWHRS